MAGEPLAIVQVWGGEDQRSEERQIGSFLRKTILSTNNSCQRGVREREIYRKNSTIELDMTEEIEIKERGTLMRRRVWHLH